MLGTVRKNKPQLPMTHVKKEVYSSTFHFTKDTTVVSYIPKKHKQVILMSTMHHSDQTSLREDKKPQIILDYNSTKGAVDTLDQLVATYTCKRKTNRWPMVLFYNMLDITAYSAFVLWREINPGWKRNNLHKRRLFIEELGKLLVTPYISSRANKPRTEQAAAIVRSLQPQELVRNTGLGTPRHTAKRARCKFCPSTCDNKTNIICCKCNKFICKGHAEYFCPNCKM